MSGGPSAQYKKLEYWNARYESEESYDWLLKYDALRPHLEEEIRRSDKILVLGCGNSQLSEEMYKDGFTDITNVDYSPVVITAMSSKNEVTARMSWLVMDVTAMDFEPGSFDVVLEKATLDGLLVDEKDPWHLSPSAQLTMDRVMGSVRDILKLDGKFVSISFGQPHFRSKIFANVSWGWSFNYKAVGDAFHFFIYIMKKGEKLSNKYLEQHSGPTLTSTSSTVQEELDEEFLSTIDM